MTGTDEPVGTALARMRRARMLTGAALAARVGMSQPKISRIERGKGTVDPADVRKLARALGASRDETRRLVERAELSYERLTDWRPGSASLASRQTTVGDWERAAEVIREFQPVAVPGLLQSSGYAEAVLNGIQQLIMDDPEPTPVVLAAVAERVRRQQLLGDRRKSFRFVVTESALRNEVCDPAEMLAQMGRLREATARPNVDIGVIPDGVPLALAPMHGFMVVDDSLLIVDVFNTGLLSRSRTDIASYRRIFDIFAGQAGPPESLLDKYESYYIDRLRARRPAL
ncbi:helix-turn-helix domain-containing protein [Actinoplanes sp. NPDC051343]|uniref:helix-turn-helix domain-containing protein n=1 Tax=Actinoplanes sp. NPDC051343 TaxID=3363906 RepID=UPI0037BCDA3E